MIKNYLKNIKKYGKKIRSMIGKEFIKEPSHESNKRAYINSKIREFGGVVRTNFSQNKVSKAPEEKFPYKCLSLIKLETIIRSEETLYYPQTILKECKYDLKNIKRSRLITDEFEKNPSDESDNEPETK